MSETPQPEEHRYECPKCGCTFTRRADEPEVCKCPSCDTEVNTAQRGCTCCD